MSKELAEQLNTVQKFVGLDKETLDTALKDAVTLLENAKLYIRALKKIQRLTNTLKSVTKVDHLEKILTVLDRYPQIKSLREAEVLMYSLEALSTKQIAEKLSISEKTVKHHKTNIFSRTGFKTTLEMIRDNMNKERATLPHGN